MHLRMERDFQWIWIDRIPSRESEMSIDMATQLAEPIEYCPFAN